MTYIIKGNWKKGLAFDKHTLSSSYLGVDQFGHDRWENTRTEMGELVYQLKYHQDEGTVRRIIDLLDRVKGIEEMDRIVPIPPTLRTRPFQPVRLIAEALGERRRVRVIPDLLEKIPGSPQLKDVEEPRERRNLLQKSMRLSEKRFDISDLKVLLVDDLFRSGSTLSAATELLLSQTRVSDVFVLTMTMTRSKR